MITREQFDTVYNGLAAQGWKQSTLPCGTCAYRDPTHAGRKCAVGHLIPDGHYDPVMDDDHTGVGIWGLGSFQNIGLLGNLTHDEFQILQSTHDNNPLPADMKTAFDDLRKEWFPDDAD
ncbi:hypothetical protein [Aquibium oceanicum]|uniref:Uncharacterized protein n=1 Tax=Aquibium oceanicum TaxID=1670800 RepID=A0A1L3SXK5_9HYPH|nr:hypothetical protein [Aquibium oceanicum]APH74149.1 hypothetical protein BSQ44_24330 [Aquibium oceanicum]